MVNDVLFIVKTWLAKIYTQNMYEVDHCIMHRIDGIRICYGMIMYMKKDIEVIKGEQEST